MENFSWKRVLRLAIPLSIISIMIIAFVMNGDRKSNLSDGDFIGKKKTDFMDKREVLLEKVVRIDLDDENYDTFFFNETNICIGHFQKAEGKYFKDIYDKLVKRKGQPSGMSKEIENGIDVIVWADGTELMYKKELGVQVKEIGKGFEEYLKGL